MKTTVLIADDLKFFIETEKSYLQRGGFEVMTAMSGEEAVAVASARRPSLVLLDLEMPKMDGAAACAAMRQVPALASTTIIIMSARGDAQTRERCLKAGCTEFVIKPEKPEDLLGVVARVLAVRMRDAERITVVFDIVGGKASAQVIGRACNLSVTGLLLESSSPLPTGTRLRLEFYLPRTKSQIKVGAEVVRTAVAPDGAHQAGVRFTDLSQADQEQILDYSSS